MAPFSSMSMCDGGGLLRQPGHRHHVAADQHHEAGAGREPHLAHVQRVAERCAAQAASVEKEYCVLATQTGRSP